MYTTRTLTTHRIDAAVTNENLFLLISSSSELTIGSNFATDKKENSAPA